MSDNTGVTVTFKGGQGYDAPWIVIHAESVQDAKSQIDTGDFATLAERTVAASEFFRGAYNVKGGLAANSGPAQPAAPQGQPQGPWSQQGSGASAPATSQGYGPAHSHQAPPAFVTQAPPQGGYQQPAQAAPEGPAKHCIHGEMTYREGTGKTGKPYKAYFCPTAKGTPGQCQAEFVR